MSVSKAAGAATVTWWPARARATPRPRYGSTSPRDPRVRRVIRSRRLPVMTEDGAPAAIRSRSTSLPEGFGFLAGRWEGDFHRLVDLLERQFKEGNGGLCLRIPLGPGAQLHIEPVLHKVIAVDGDGIAPIGPSRLRPRGGAQAAHFKGIGADRHPV